MNIHSDRAIAALLASHISEFRNSCKGKVLHHSDCAYSMANAFVSDLEVILATMEMHRDPAEETGKRPNNQRDNFLIKE